MTATLAPVPTGVLGHSIAAKDARLDTIVLVMSMFGAGSAREGLIAVKSALMHISRPVDFHIICSEDALDVILEKLALVTRYITETHPIKRVVACPRPAYPVHFKLYLYSSKTILDRAARASVGSKHYAAAGGIAKVFLHEILPDVDRALYFDTDMIFTVDPFILWKNFDAFEDQHEEILVSFPTLGPKSDVSHICTCVMLLNLEGMRQQFFMPSTLFPQDTIALATPKTFAAAGIDPYNPRYGDQGLYFGVWKSYGLGLDDGDDSMTEEQQILRQHHTNKQLFPGILHFNCLDGHYVWQNEKAHDAPQWGPFVQLAAQYKWIWLNRGDGSAEMKVTVVPERLLWDEVMYGGKNTEDQQR
ncbi:hypothetical protein FISHEDRAFT_62126 [Fistulina hepatica ATCC 64428]|nr:hypothetical protein FISHEDRAFT_62126 [Fistulina hepatica ATCC 64428]